MQTHESRSHKTVYVVTAVAGLLLVALLLGRNGEPSPALAEIGGRLPEFELHTAQGDSTLASDALTGDVLVLNFWTTSCTSCLQEIEELKRLHAKQHVRVVGIALDSDVDRVRQVITARNINYEVLIGTSEVFERFDGYAIPYTIVLDKSRIVRLMVSGKMSYDEILKAVSDIDPTTTAANSHTNIRSRS